MVLGLFDTVAAFDTLTGKAWVIAQDIADNRPAKADRAKAMAKRIDGAWPLGPVDWSAIGHWTADLSRAEYESMVSRVIEYIHAGDTKTADVAGVYQAYVKGTK